MGEGANNRATADDRPHRRRRDTGHRYLVSLQVAVFPVQTVAVRSRERAVKVVTEAASAALGEEQHVWISGRLEHRRQLSNIEEQAVACAVPG